MPEIEENEPQAQTPLPPWATAEDPWRAASLAVRAAERETKETPHA